MSEKLHDLVRSGHDASKRILKWLRRLHRLYEAWRAVSVVESTLRETRSSTVQKVASSDEVPPLPPLDKLPPLWREDA